MTDIRQEPVPLSRALGNGTVGQPPRARPSLKALAARVLENSQEPVPLSHALGNGTVGQAATATAGVKQATWDSEDWHAHFDERAGIAEHVGGLSRADAERQAWQCCVVEMQWRCPPPPSPPERCAYCAEPLGEPGRDGLPYLAGDSGPAWLHNGCHGAWTAELRADAVAALAGLGLTPPDDIEG